MVALSNLFLFATLLFVVSAELALNPNLIKSINLNGKSTWKAGSNKNFRGSTIEEVKHLLGWKPNPNSPFRSRTHQNEKIALPATYDASQAYPKCTTIGTIYDQAECGSCWAFGCIEAVQDRFCIQNGNTTVVSLSFMDEVTCGPDDGCEGGDAGDAWEYVAESGVVTAACYPYTIPTCLPQQEPCLNFTATPACTQQCVDKEQWTKSKHFISTVYGVSSDASQIQTEIFQNGPVEACFDVYEDFLSYKSGVYQYQSGSYLGGHCIKMIGWGTENGTPYWLCNNSWTTYWGDDGQFKILRGSDECGIEDDVVAGMVN